MKKLIVFDLDGTLAESKSALDAEMAALLGRLMSIVKVAVISGGNWPQFEAQLLANLPRDPSLQNLSLLPTCGTKFYQYGAAESSGGPGVAGWQLRYSEDFSAAERSQVIAALKQAIGTSYVSVQRTWGNQIEDRGSQITFSAPGQEAPIEEKKKWDPDFSKRKKIKALLDRCIPEFSVRMGGTTSVDITKLGIDKAYGIRKLRDTLGIAISEMVFVGDAL